MFRNILVSSLLLLSLESFGEGLCEKNEVEAFSCNVKDNKVSVCVTENKYLYYRFGNSEKIELELLSDVSYSSTAYSGGGEERLTFHHDGINYIVYSGMSNSGWLDEELGIREKSEFAGVYMTKGIDVVENLECTSFDSESQIHSLPSYTESEFVQLNN